MKKIGLAIFVFAGLIQSSYAATYQMQYKCPNANPAVEWFSADSDLEAFNKANEILRNRSTKGCVLISVKRD